MKYFYSYAEGVGIMRVPYEDLEEFLQHFSGYRIFKSRAEVEEVYFKERARK